MFDFLKPRPEIKIHKIPPQDIEEVYLLYDIAVQTGSMTNRYKLWEKLASIEPTVRNRNNWSFDFQQILSPVLKEEIQ